jgi:hypothetical protein
VIEQALMRNGVEVPARLETPPPASEALSPRQINPDGNDENRTWLATTRKAHENSLISAIRFFSESLNCGECDHVFGSAHTNKRRRKPVDSGKSMAQKLGLSANQT